MHDSVGWLKRQGAKEFSPLGVKVAEILGLVWRGIYHLNFCGKTQPDWSDERCIQMTVFGELATHDLNLLSQLVICAHERKVRIAVTGAANRYLRLVFMDALNCVGKYPTIEEAAQSVRQKLAEKVVGHA